jgi:hypothetical protein
MTGLSQLAVASSKGPARCAIHCQVTARPRIIGMRAGILPDTAAPSTGVDAV